MPFTTVNTHGDYSATKPALTPGSASNTPAWVRDSGSGVTGSTDRAEVMNDMIANIRAAATAAGVDLTTMTRGSEVALTQIIEGLSGLSVEKNTSSAGVTAPVANAGPRPLILFDNQWVAMQAGVTTNVVNELLPSILSLQNSAVAATTSLRGNFVGQFTCTLANVSSTSAYTDASITTADRGKPVYLHTTGAEYRYALWRDIHPDQRYTARQIGTLIDTSGTTHTVFHNTLQQEPRVNQRRIWTGNATSGTQTLINENFLDWSQIIMYTGLDNRSTNPQLHTQPIVIPIPIFVRGDAWIGTQESHLADAFLRIRYRSPTQFEVYAHTGNLSTGIREIWGVK